MAIEEYIKLQLAVKKISFKDAAEVLGYTKNSFYNKLSKHNLNLHDLIVLSIIFGQKMMLADEQDTPLYLFNPNDYLSDDDKERITKFNDKRAAKLDFSLWFKSLPEDKKKYIFSGINRSREEMLKLTVQKHSEGCVEIESPNFNHLITVCGANCQDAAEWIEEKIKNTTPEDEIIFCVASEKFFDVYIFFESPTSYVV